MKKLYSIFAAVVFAVAVNAQTKTVSITNANAGGSAVLGAGGYNSGAERTWTTAGIGFAGKAITSNNSNSPAGSAANTNIQCQATNAVFYNTTALPGKILSITINYIGTARDFTFSGGDTTRLVNNTTGNYTVTGGTVVGSPSSTGWTTADLTGTNYTYFALKIGTGGTAYITSIDIVYEDTVLAVGDINSTKANLVKNTSVDNTLNFAAKADVKIVNMNGQVVKTASVNENTAMDVADLAKGMYIVTGVVNGKAVSEKIIKK
ncbi:T9SS type A sorting domain-containing protein [Chryseobacterium koreense]|uniref:T9SS type A sorting domain-containing protein n=1 Tax=Chryseobacterium koreense TaxID=232216 RepID=UPI0026EC86D4|nr:T9SS type A sorting domain-containing protein [Chryseobacterium koreense]